MKYQKFRVDITKNGVRNFVTTYAPDEQEAVDSIKETFKGYKVVGVKAFNEYIDDTTYNHTGK